MDKCFKCGEYKVLVFEDCKGNEYCESCMEDDA